MFIDINVYYSSVCDVRSGDRNIPNIYTAMVHYQSDRDNLSSNKAVLLNTSSSTFASISFSLAGVCAHLHARNTLFCGMSGYVFVLYGSNENPIFTSITSSKESTKTTWSY